MSGMHASDAELQQYLTDRASCGDGLIRHIEGCAVCHVALENYRLILSALPAVPAPKFDFDVAAMVKAKLPEAPPVRRPFYPIWIMVFAGFIPLYLFRKNLQVLFTEVNVLFLGVMAVAAVCILLFMLYMMNRQYQRRLEELSV